ncbi:MAG: DUF5777 family beta-barrel protein [Candidatus Kapabacteria bacterium]|nr:DUF5777 family beta-barrel protein [Candidatus Kapabacteria bacterium]
MKKFQYIVLILLATSLFGQESSWTPEPVTELKFQLFNSTNAINQPTAETYKKGNILFGIEHRFSLPISSGIDNLWGLEGASSIRVHLGYAFTEYLNIDLARSNRMGNTEITIKQRLFENNDESFPLIVSAVGGLAYNTKGVPDELGTSRRFQPFGSIVLNTVFENGLGKFGLGLVPTYVYNTNINDAGYTNPDYSFTMGMYAQYFINHTWSVLVEATPTVAGWRNTYNSYAFAVEVEMGGHFYKFIYGNNVAMNIAQFNSGSTDEFGFKNLRFGFQITRDF